MNENQLIMQSKEGDQEAFGELVLIYSDYVFSIVFRLINIETDAEDITQNTFVRAWMRIGTYEEKKSKFTTWLYTIATRLALDHIRKRKPEMELQENMESNVNFERDLENKELGELIKRACSGLSEQQKLVFVLRDLEDLDVNEVVHITGFSEKKIKDNLYIARKKIREKVGDLIKV